MSGSLLVWVVHREGLLDLLPLAPEALLDRMTDGVIVFDRDGQVLITNESARAFSLNEQTLARALGQSTLRNTPRQWRTEVQIDSGGAGRWLDVRIDPVFDRWGTLAGRVVVARDVTFLKALEDEREQLVDEL